MNGADASSKDVIFFTSKDICSCGARVRHVSGVVHALGGVAKGNAHRAGGGEERVLHGSG